MGVQPGAESVAEEAGLDAGDARVTPDTVPLGDAGADSSESQRDAIDAEADVVDSSDPCDSARTNLTPFIITYDTRRSTDETPLEAVIDPGTEYEDIPYDIDVDADGTYEMRCVSGKQTLEFGSSGENTVHIRGMPRFSIPKKEDASGLVEVSQWGDHAWLSMRRSFRWCKNLELTATDTPNLELVTDMSGVFFMAELVDCDDSTLQDWNTSSVRNLRQAFWGAKSFNCELNGWDVSEVTDLSETFKRAKAFDRDLNSWDTSKVTVMEQAFMAAESFNGDVSNWDTGNVTDFHETFRGAKRFDQSLGGWDISSANSTANESMSGMLRNAGLSRENYDQTLHEWACAASTPEGVTLGANKLTYCYRWSRDRLVTDQRWTIRGDRPAEDCSMVTVPEACPESD